VVALRSNKLVACSDRYIPINKIGIGLVTSWWICCADWVQDKIKTIYN